MSDFFVRDRLHQLTGLTKMAKKNGTETALADDVWTTIFTEASTSVHQIFKAYKIDLGVDVSTAEVRIMAAAVSDPGSALDSPDNKTFPFGDSTEILSGVDMYLDFPLQVPKAHEYFIQVKAPGTGANFTATLNYLSVINVPLINAE